MPVREIEDESLVARWGEGVGDEGSATGVCKFVE